MLEKIQIMDAITLKELRQLTGMTQDEFAEYVDMPVTTYRRYEQDPGRIEFKKMYDICKKLDIDISLIRL